CMPASQTACSACPATLVAAPIFPKAGCNMASTDKPNSNRRASMRRSAKRSTQVVCFANNLGLGPNISVSLLDVSESGARLRVKTALKPHQEIEINLSGIGHRQPVKILAEVVWCVAADDGTFVIGVKFLR